MCSFFRLFLGLNHICFLEPGLLAIGYLNVSSYHDPALALVKLDTINTARPLSVIKDLRDAVCMCEEMDAPHHRFFTRYLEQW